MIVINAESLLERFVRLAEIPSPSGHEDAVAREAMDMLRGLGVTSERDEAGNVFARVEGVGEPVLLTAHLDTVTPADHVVAVIRNGVVYSDGTSVLGADDKSGVAIIIEVLDALRGLQHRPLEVLFTVQEEIGLLGAGAFDVSRLSSRIGIGLDANGPWGNVIVSAPGQNSLRAVMHGKASHAGVAPEAGINAIRVAAEAIVAMPLGRIDSETTSNIGVIEGGKATNIVPDTVILQGEARSRNADKLQAQTETMVDALKKAAAGAGATVDVEVKPAYAAYVLAEDSAAVQFVCAGARGVGIEPQLTAGGGGSDANIFCAAGIETIQLSTGMAGFHTCEEYIRIEDMVQSARIVAQSLVAD